MGFLESHYRANVWCWKPAVEVRSGQMGAAMWPEWHRHCLQNEARCWAIPPPWGCLSWRPLYFLPPPQTRNTPLWPAFRFLRGRCRDEARRAGPGPCSAVVHKGAGASEAGARAQAAAQRLRPARALD